MAFIVTKRGTAGPPRGPQRRVKEPEAWGLPMRHLLGFFIRAIWRFDYLDFDLATSQAAKQSSQAKGKSGVPNSSIALAFIIISERCYS